MDEAKRADVLRRLSAPFPEDAVERTHGSVNGKGYDTTGVRVQHVINRLNDVVGLGGFRVGRSFQTRERTTSRGTTIFEVICDLELALGHWEDGSFVTWAETSATGGHVAPFEADARKGAHSNAFKKAAATFGVGWQFYAGVADEDNEPVPMDARKLPPQPRSAPPATEPQRAMLRRLVAGVGGTPDHFAEYLERTRGVRMAELDRRTASELITELQESTRTRNGRQA